jgi:hypothetical protein
MWQPLHALFEPREDTRGINPLRKAVMRIMGVRWRLMLKVLGWILVTQKVTTRPLTLVSVTVFMIATRSFGRFYFSDMLGVYSADEHYLNDATSRELLRLRKDELVRLYSAAGLSEDAEHLTKHDLVQAIISAREDVAEVPPSSPSGFTSSDGSSDDGHFAGGEETDIGNGYQSVNGANGLRRRVTVQAVAPSARTRPAVTTRTMSLGTVDKSHINRLKVALVKYPAVAIGSTSR